MRVIEVDLFFGGRSPNYYLLLSQTIRGFPQPRLVGKVGYQYISSALSYRGVHFESQVSGAEMREIASEYMLAEGYSPAPDPAPLLPAGVPKMPEPPKSMTISAFMRGETNVYVVVNEKERGGVTVSVDEYFQ
jgi:hypothetical protein